MRGVGCGAGRPGGSVPPTPTDWIRLRTGLRVLVRRVALPGVTTTKGGDGWLAGQGQPLPSGRPQATVVMPSP